MNSIEREVLPLMKFVTVDAFGLGILDGFEFGCSERLELQPFAASFDHLVSELIRRFSRPWDPSTFLYGLPTAANREYKMHRTRIRNFVQDHIAQGRVRIDEEERMGNNRSRNNDSIQKHKDRCIRKRSYDLMTNLIKAASAEANKYADDAAYVKLVEETLNDVFITLLFGAYETASISLTYALYLLATHPEVQRNCVEEVQKIMGRREKQKSTESDSSKSGDLEDVSNDVDIEDLPYTKAVMMETMRLFPAVPVTRRNLEMPVKLPSNGKILPKGQLVNISIWCVQRSEFNFPRPEEMIPERWVRRRRNPQETDDCVSPWEDRGPDDDDDINAIIAPANRDAFFTFAHGARNCVGKVFAMQETVIILACLVKKLQFDIVSPDYELKPIICGFVQQPLDKLPMKIRERC